MDMKYKVGDKIVLTRTINAFSVEERQKRERYLIVRDITFDGCGNCNANICDRIRYVFEGDTLPSGWCGVEKHSELWKWEPMKPKKFKLC